MSRRFNVHSLVCMRQINFDPEKQQIIIPKRLFDLYLVDYCNHLRLALDVQDDYATVTTDQDGCAMDRSGNIVPKVTAEILVDVHIGQYEAEIWYPQLRSTTEGERLTFYSEFVQLDTFQMELLLGIYDRTGDINRLKSSETYQRLLSQLDKCFEQFSSKGITKVFVKLNSVSPKDICFYDDDPYGDVNALAAYRGEHVIHMLSRSSRCMSVLRRTINHRLPNPVLIMLREFVELPIKNEFRCFVYDGKLRAISQYHWMVQDQEIMDKRFVIRDRIEEFYSLAKEFIPYKDCIMDLILLDDETQFSRTFMNLGIYLVEFNCFGGDLVAGSALYHWFKDRDILYGNEGVSDIRVSAMFAEELSNI